MIHLIKTQLNFCFRNVAKNSTEKTEVDVKMEYDASSSTQSEIQKQKKTKERSTTQVHIF